LAAIENTINAQNSATGTGKPRLDRAQHSNPSHLLIKVFMLAKPYRDRDFIIEIRNATEPTVKAHLQQPCYFSLSISFFDHLQITNKYAGPAA
jgi:hypothetical protein